MKVWEAIWMVVWMAIGAALGAAGGILDARGGGPNGDPWARGDGHLLLWVCSGALRHQDWLEVGR